MLLTELGQLLILSDDLKFTVRMNPKVYSYVKKLTIIYKASNLHHHLFT